MKNVLITGATGFLGSYLLKRFLDNEDIIPIILIREKRGKSALERIENILRYFYGADKYKIILKRIRVVNGDVTSEFLGMDRYTRKVLADDIDEIYHSAAIAEFKIPLEKIRKVNVKGAENVFRFALECKKTGRIAAMNHISTAYVAGATQGVFHENDLDVGQKFNNTYEQSKFEAELLVERYRKESLKMTVFRPSILTGDYEAGRTTNFKMLYQPLHFFASELFESIPANRDARLNLIPVDHAAQAICLVASEKAASGRTFHIVNSSTVTINHFVDMASDFFGFRKPEFIPQEDFDIKTLTTVQKRLIDPFTPYFNRNPEFDATGANEILNKKRFQCSPADDELLIKLFRFCVEAGFIKFKRHYVVTG